MRTALLVAVVFLVVAAQGSAAERRPRADVSVTASATRTVRVGGTVRFTTTVRNRGPQAAWGVEVVLTLPFAITSYDLGSPPWTRARCESPPHFGGSFRCRLARLGPGAARVLRFEGGAPRAGFVRQRVSVRSGTHDPRFANNAARATTPAFAPPERVGPARAFALAPSGEVEMRLGSHCWLWPVGTGWCADGPPPGELQHLEVAPGDVVTFRLDLTLSSASFNVGGRTFGLEAANPTWRVPDDFGGPSGGLLAVLFVRGESPYARAGRGDAVYYARLM